VKRKDGKQNAHGMGHRQEERSSTLPDTRSHLEPFPIEEGTPLEDIPLGVPGLEDQLGASKVRSVEDVLDYAATCALAVANGGVPVKLSKELRLWGELMYSCVQAQNMLGGEGDVNFIGQLIQIAGNPEAPRLADAAKARIIETTSVVEPAVVTTKAAVNE